MSFPHATPWLARASSSPVVTPGVQHGAAARGCAGSRSPSRRRRHLVRRLGICARPHSAARRDEQSIAGNGDSTYGNPDPDATVLTVPVPALASLHQWTGDWDTGEYAGWRRFGATARVASRDGGRRRDDLDRVGVERPLVVARRRRRCRAGAESPRRFRSSRCWGGSGSATDCATTTSRCPGTSTRPPATTTPSARRTSTFFAPTCGSSRCWAWPSAPDRPGFCRSSPTSSSRADRSAPPSAPTASRMYGWSTSRRTSGSPSR